MSTLHALIGQGLTVWKTLPLIAGHGDYRIDGVTRDPQERYVLYDGFVDPIAAQKRFAFTHVKPDAMESLSHQALLTPQAYEVALHCVHQQVEYGRTIPLLNGNTQEIQIHELGRPTLDEAAIEWAQDAQATWAIEPPSQPGGEARLYILTPAKAPAAHPTGGIDDDEGLLIGSLRLG